MDLQLQFPCSQRGWAQLFISDTSTVPGLTKGEEVVCSALLQGSVLPLEDTKTQVNPLMTVGRDTLHCFDTIEKEPTARNEFPSAPLQPIIPISQLPFCAGTAPFPGKKRLTFLNILKCYFQKLVKAVKHSDSPKMQGTRGRNLRHVALVGWEKGCA